MEVTGCPVTFVTYSLSGHDLNPAIIFSGLQYFNIIKTPITFLPLALTATTDAVVGIGEQNFSMAFLPSYVQVVSGKCYNPKN